MHWLAVGGAQRDGGTGLEGDKGAFSKRQPSLPLVCPLQRARIGQECLAPVSLEQPCICGECTSLSSTRALLLMSTDKALRRQTEATLLVWKHLQLITQAVGYFRNHLTLTSRREDRQLGQASSGLTSLPGCWPVPPLRCPGPLPRVFAFNPHYTIRLLLSLVPFYRGDTWLK